MRYLHAIFFGLVIAATGWTAVEAQQAIGSDARRNCQVIRSCNFARTAAVRGCLSSYTCRTCRLVKARCSLGGRSRCEELVCSWGG